MKSNISQKLQNPSSNVSIKDYKLLRHACEWMPYPKGY